MIECHEVFGDGLVVGKETCDDSNLITKDGCNENGQTEQYWECDNS